MANTQSGKATKDALADALVTMLSGGTPLNKIPIRRLTESCGVDRQTFYYHFKSIYDLAEYACKNEAVKLFSSADGVDFDTLTWPQRLELVMRRIEKDATMRDSIIPALGETALRERFIASIREALDSDLLPTLVEHGFSEQEARSSVELISLMLYAVLIAWVSHDIDKPIADVLADLTAMVDDYVRGAQARLDGKS